MAERNAPLRVKDLDHVTLVVKDLEATRQFYVEILGMREVERPAFSFAGKWFQAGATLVHVTLEGDRTGPAGQGVAEGRTSRSNHFAFIVPDAQRAAEFLQGRGLPIFAGPQKRPDGATQVFVLDPDGYMVELCSTP